jgi:hypothetical protein
MHYDISECEQHLEKYVDATDFDPAKLRSALRQHEQGIITEPCIYKLYARLAYEFPYILRLKAELEYLQNVQSQLYQLIDATQFALQNEYKLIANCEPVHNTKRKNK